MNIEICDKIYERKLNWNDGKLYCDLLIIDGKDDWRLPTLEELTDISYIDNDFYQAIYWSFDSYKSEYIMFYYREFTNKSKGLIGMNDSSARYFIRPVRTI